MHHLRCLQCVIKLVCHETLMNLFENCCLGGFKTSALWQIVTLCKLSFPHHFCVGGFAAFFGPLIVELFRTFSFTPMTQIT